MRDTDRRSGMLFSYADIEARVPATQPLRRIRELVNNGLARLNKSFGKLYSDEGRPSIPPEQLLRPVLLRFVPRSRSERQLMERIPPFRKGRPS